MADRPRLPLGARCGDDLGAPADPGGGLRSYSEPWLDTTSPFGEALYYITAAYAQLERGILAERVKAGMERARREGRPLGRPSGTSKANFQERWADLRPRLLAGQVSRRKAARLLGVSRSTVIRLLGSQVLPLPG